MKLVIIPGFWCDFRDFVLVCSVSRKYPHKNELAVRYQYVHTHSVDVEVVLYL